MTSNSPQPPELDRVEKGVFERVVFNQAMRRSLDVIAKQLRIYFSQV